MDEGVVTAGQAAGPVRLPGTSAEPKPRDMNVANLIPGGRTVR